MLQVVTAFVSDEDGATAVEYGVLAAVIAVGAILAFTAFGGSLVALFGTTEEGAGVVFDNANGQL